MMVVADGGNAADPVEVTVREADSEQGIDDTVDEEDFGHAI